MQLEPNSLVIDTQQISFNNVNKTVISFKRISSDGKVYKITKKDFEKLKIAGLKVIDLTTKTTFH